MPSPLVLVKQSILLFGHNILYLVKFWLVEAGLMLVASLPIVLSFIPATKDNPFVAIFLILGVVTVAGTGIWLAAASLVQLKTIITSQPQPIKALLAQGWHIAAKLFIVTLLTGLAVGLGTILLVIPGLMAAVYLGFSRAAVVFKSDGVRAALSHSRSLVKGRFWTAVKYWAVILLVYLVWALAVSLLPYQTATQILLLPAGTIFALYSLLLYQQLAGKV